jgi:hypothetical protein
VSADVSPPVQENASGEAGVEGDSKNRLQANNTTRRAPPAYQQYAATRLAHRGFKMMRLAERGLVHTLELEMWCNGTVPADKTALARVLGLDEGEVSAALTPLVLACFERSGDDLFSPELESYRQKLDENYQNRAAAGRKNIEAINSRRRTRTSNPSSDSSDDLTGAKYSTNQTSQNPTLKSGGIPEEHRDFVAALDGESETLSAAARAYRAVRGG